MNISDTYSQQATFDQILRKLVAFRIQAGTKRHDLHFWHQFSPVPGPCLTHSEAVDDIMPPRRQWIRPRKAKRKNRPAFKVWEQALYSTIQSLHAQDRLDKVEWGQRLLIQIAKIQAIWTDPSNWIPAPRVVPQPEYGKIRIITQYPDITDRVVLSFASKYLAKQLDGLWSNHSHAFRPPGPYGLRPAVKSILAYTESFSGAELYVAECDIQQFFDCLPHDVIREHIATVLRRVDHTHPPVASQALSILDKFLASYDFHTTAIPAVDNYNLEHPRNTVATQLPLDLNKIYGKALSTSRIGIPQGGALSPLIANIVMDSVDRAVLSTNDPDLFYARYCDDMILIHPDKRKCQAALDRYLHALQQLRLVPHPPVPRSRHTFENDDAKSKAPYLWSPKTDARIEAAECIQFLGYKFRRDGSLSLRDKTIRKHKEKLHRLVAKTTRMIATPTPKKAENSIPSALPKQSTPYDSERLPGERLLKKIRLRMISAVVGRENLMKEGLNIRQPCWASAFDLLAHAPASEAIQQLKDLDRDRERKIKFLAKQFHSLQLMPSKAEDESPMRRKKKYYGAPFSYYSIAGATSRKKLKSQPGTQVDGFHYGHI